MPSLAPRLCGCGRIVAGGQSCPCKAVKRKQHDQQRGTSAQRGYDAAWKRCRRLYLEQHPNCSTPGCGEAATDPDHIISIAERPDLRLSWSNLRPYCHSCHSRRTARDQGFARFNRD